MHNDRDAKISLLKSEVSLRRAAWYDVREKMQARKNELAAMNYAISAVRKDREYKQLRKLKKRLSKEIRHLEQKINRATARLEKPNGTKK